MVREVCRGADDGIQLPEITPGVFSGGRLKGGGVTEHPVCPCLGFEAYWRRDCGAPLLLKGEEVARLEAKDYYWTQDPG